MKLTHLTTLILFVLQTGNAYDGESLLDDFNDGFTDAETNEKFNLNIDQISLEDNSQISTTPQPSKPSMQPFETFMLKKTINPTINSHIETHNMRNMKAYKIVSKEPIIGNSLVKIVMAPQHVLEKLSKQQGNLKYVTDKIDKSANAPIKYYSDDGAFDRKLIQNINVDNISSEKEADDGVKKAKQPEKNVVHHESNNIQVIAKSHKGPLNVNSKHQKVENSIEIKRFNHVEAITNNDNKMNDKIEDAIHIDLSTDKKQLDSEPRSTTSETPTDSNLPMTYTEAEELLSNPKSSNNLIQSSTRGDTKPEFSDLDASDSTEINSSVMEPENSSSEIPQMTLQDISAENHVPLVVLKILKNRTVLVEETDPQSIPDLVSMDTTVIPKSLPADIRPKIISRPTTTTIAPTVVENKQKKFPKKVNLVDSYGKYKTLPRLDDTSMSLELTPSMSLLDMETTNNPTPQSATTEKNKNIKRAIGDEGTFSKIVRPSPIRQKNIGDYLRNETDVERAERLNKSLQRLMHFVTIVGQVDSYLTKRFRSGLKNVARILDSVEDTRRRRRNSYV